MRPYYNIPKWDFILFYAAAHFVNSPAILEPGPLLRYEKLYHFGLGLYPYPPAFAWLYLPLIHLPYIMAYFVYAAFSVVLICAIAEYAMRIFGLSRPLGYLLTFAWSPMTAALILGQNSLIGLALFLGTGFCLEQRRPLLAGLCVGFLFYKPSYALYLLLWFIFRREWFAIFSTAVVGLGWYGAGILATGGDRAWPMAWLHLLKLYRLPDAISNQDATIGLVGVLERIGTPFGVAISLTSLLFIYAMYRARKFDLRTQLFFLCSLIPALGPHALTYDAVLTLPALLHLLVTHERWRSALLAWSYLPAAAWLIAHSIHFNLLALFTAACPLLMLYWDSQSVRHITPASL